MLTLPACQEISWGLAGCGSRRLEFRLILEDHRARVERTDPGPFISPSPVTEEPMRDIRGALDELEATGEIGEGVTATYLRRTYASVLCRTQDQGAAMASTTRA
jgi:hypothetical protein